MNDFINSLPLFSQVKLNLNHGYLVRHHGKVFMAWWDKDEDCAVLRFMPRFIR